MAAVEAWLEGGVGDGKLTYVETAVDGTLPDEIVFLQAGVFTGSDDEPAPSVIYRYRRLVGGDLTYRYTSSSEARRPDPGYP